MKTARVPIPDVTALSPKARGGLLALIALAAAFPVVAANDYAIYVMTLAYIMGISAIGLNLILGYTGQLNLAHGGFMGIGAYTLGILTADYGIPFWIAFLAAGMVTGGLGLLGGLLSLRLKTHTFVIFTLCVGFIIFLVIEKWDALTHGTAGLIGIPAPPDIGPLSFATPLGQYYLVLGFLVLALFVMGRIVRSLLGRAFIAIRNGEDLAETLGIPLMRTKVLAFVISTIYAGFAGALYAGLVRVLGPGIAHEGHTFEMVAFILVGGVGTLFGPVLGAVLLTWLTQSLQFLEDYRMIVYGPMLILLVMYVPRGIVGSLRDGLMRCKQGGPVLSGDASRPAGPSLSSNQGREAEADA